MFVSRLELSLLEQLLFVLILAYAALSGRMHWVLGIHLSISLWTRVFLIGPVANIWVTMAALVGAALVELHLNKRIPETPQRHRGVVIWMGLWWLWMLLLIFMYQPTGMRGLLRQFGFYIMIPLVLIVQYRWTPERIRSFAIAFMLTMLYGGWKALQLIEIDLGYILIDPTLSQTSILRLNLANYHWFGYGFALSLIFTVGIFIQIRRRPLAQLALVLNATVCIYFLFMAGSRQALNGALVVGTLIALWALLSGKGPRGGVVALVAVVSAIGIWIYNTAPQLLLRDGESTGAIFDLFGDRSGYWLIGWQNFLSSPVWGTGWVEAVYTHNLFVSVLADQGVVGMVFFLGFLCFVLWQLPGVLLGVGSVEVAAWRITFLGVVIFAVIHGMASGNTLSVWYMYWASAFLWALRDMLGATLDAPPQPRPVVIGSVAGRPIMRPSLTLRGR